MKSDAKRIHPVMRELTIRLVRPVPIQFQVNKSMLRNPQKALPMKLRRSDFSLLVLCLCIALPAACGGGVIAPPSVGGKSLPPDYAQQAASGVQALQQWYVESSGLYAAPSGWWNAANSITVLSNYERVSGSTSLNSVLANTFGAAQAAHANFLNSYYDDDGWWALAWIDAYDLTRNPAYLSMAETIFAAMAGGWDTTTCGGGVWWNTSRTYKNAIPNELFLAIAAELAYRTSGSASSAYLQWAQLEWAWFKSSGMINAQSLVNDGLSSTDPKACTNNGGNTWTYNQGVIVGGLVELYKADRDPTLLPQAEAIADAAIAKLTTADGILNEKAVTGKDAPQFKGVFLRNLMALYAEVPDQRYKTFAEANANSILARDEGTGARFGALWQGPFDSADATRQTSALDALIAAAAMQ
jgi:predicted alpha-1,6-mannanase (GH76 family)